MALATPTRRMPIPEQVRDFFGDLFGKGVSVERAGELELDEDTPYVTGLFVEDGGDLGGVCIADIPFASYAGAALAMIPKPVAEEAIKAGELSESLNENFYEIANITTALLNGPAVPHLKITELVSGVPADAKDLVIKAAGRRHYKVTVTDYGSGSLALYAR